MTKEGLALRIARGCLEAAGVPILESPGPMLLRTVQPVNHDRLRLAEQMAMTIITENYPEEEGLSTGQLLSIFIYPAGENKDTLFVFSGQDAIGFVQKLFEVLELAAARLGGSQENLGTEVMRWVKMQDEKTIGKTGNGTCP